MNLRQHRRHGRQKMSIPACDLIGRRVMVDLLPVRSHLGIDTFCLKISLPKNETTVNLKSASFVVIMHLHEGLTYIESQIKPWLLFGRSFTLTKEKAEYLN